MNVLIVDDERNIRNILRLTLTRAGCTVMDAEHGERGLELALQQPFDLILLDVMMPYMDGYTFLRQLRAKEGPNKHTAAVAITALRAAADRAIAEELDVIAYLTKPFKGREVLEIVNRIRQEKGLE